MWNKIQILSGDYFYCDKYLQNKKYKKFDSSNTCEDIISHVLQFNLLDDNNIFIYNPNKDVLDKLNLITTITCDSIFIYFDNTDKEQHSFVKNAIKNKKYNNIGYIENNDFVNLDKFLSLFSIDRNAMIWCHNNAPTIIKKIDSKKEKEVYDLFLMYQEFIKILTISDQITTELLEQYCYFKNEVEVWDMVSSILSTDVNNSYIKYQNYLTNNNISSLLYLLSNQLELSIETLGYYIDNGIKNIDSLQKYLNKKNITDYYSTYFADNIKDANPPNYWRVKKIIDSKYSLDLLKLQFRIVRNALVDLHNGINEKFIIEIVFLALQQKINYLFPLVQENSNQLYNI